jgi:hypothetical protein
MKESLDKFVELNRKFHKFDQSDKVNEDHLFDSYRTSAPFCNTVSYSWEELLKEKRVVVLGEAGSGKTWELRERSKQLKQAGMFSVYVRLDQIISSPLEERLDPIENRMLASWKNNNEKGYFFLDSVDESKFQKISDFEGALRSFRNAFETDDALYERAHIILSSRISEWLPEMDKSIFTNILCPHTAIANIDKANADSNRYNQKNTNRDIEILVVTIAPLDKHQVKLFASNSEVNNVDNFIAAIDNSFAWEFTHRPLDVSDLIVFWRDKNKIGSLTELIQNSVASKLRQRNDRDDYALSQEKAFSGSKWLAAGNVFSRQFLLAICEANSVLHRGLNPAEWLPPDWTNSDIRALLNRPIFDSSLYGSVRFHHRRIMEYLAAQWLMDRCEYGCNTDKLRDLLVTQVRGKELIRSSLHPIIAWLCYGTERWSQAVKNWVLEFNPTIHLQFGDPSRFSVEDRRSLLVAVSKLASNRDYINLTADHYCLSRIASDELSDTIDRMLLDDNLSSDFRVALIKMVVSKRVRGCFNALDLIVFSSQNTHRLKETVLSNLDEIGDKEFALHIYDKLMTGPIMTRTICQSAVCSLFPKFITPGQLVRMFEHSESLVRKKGDSAFELAYYFKNLTATSLTIELLGELNSFLIRHGPSELIKKHTYHVDFIAPEYNWVTGLISITLLSVLTNESLKYEHCREVALSLCLCGDTIFEPHYHSLSEEDSMQLFKLLSKFDVVRRECFWQLLSRTREQNIDISIILFGRNRSLRLTSSDINWIVREAKYSQNSPCILIAMKAAMQRWERSGCQVAYFLRLYWALSPYPSLRDECLHTLLIYPVKYCKSLWRTLKSSRYAQQWWWKHNVWPETASFFPKLLLAVRTHLHISKIRTGEYIGWLMHFLEETDGSSHDFIVTDWSPLLASRGNRIT